MAARRRTKSGAGGDRKRPPAPTRPAPATAPRPRDALGRFLSRRAAAAREAAARRPRGPGGKFAPAKRPPAASPAAPPRRGWVEEHRELTRAALLAKLDEARAENERQAAELERVKRELEAARAGLPEAPPEAPRDLALDMALARARTEGEAFWGQKRWSRSARFGQDRQRVRDWALAEVDGHLDAAARLLVTEFDVSPGEAYTLLHSP